MLRKHGIFLCCLFSPLQGLPADTEARDIWLKFLPPERVLPYGCKDNFWEMGEQGPCGPSTEIHYDRIGGRDASSLVNQGEERSLSVLYRSIVCRSYIDLPICLSVCVCAC